ncbi:hypothetical protein ACHAWF_017442 [Thalassiosira exigua]
MRLSNGSGGGGGPSLVRRRGAGGGHRRKSGPGAGGLVLEARGLLVLVALCATIFAAGLVVGTRSFGAPSADGPSREGGGGGRGSEVASPLAAATAKIAPSDVQRLILESARAEAAEREEKEEEEEARKRGDYKKVARLRGVQAPGDANYNPHRQIDDVVGDGGEEGLGVGGGDGAMYAGDRGDHGLDAEPEAPVRDTHGEGNDSMHNHFVEALKSEMDVVKKGKDKIQEKLQTYEKEAVKKVKKIKGRAEAAVKRLRGHAKGDAGGRGSAEGGGDGDGGGERYPYLTSPVAPDHDFSKYEPLGGGRFAEYTSGDAPYAVTATIRAADDELARSRRVHVKNAMKHVWKNYKEYAFGKDELHPISHKATSNWGGMGTSLVDSLDTLWVMGLKEEFWEARDWVRDYLSNDGVGSVSGFETTIRSLGGLLSAYDLSGDEVFLKKADDLGSRLVKAYDTPSGLPHGSVRLDTGSSNNFSWNSNAYILAEVGTQQLEYRTLARSTGKTDYAKKSEKVFEILHELQPADGLLAQNIKDSGGHPKFVGNKVSFGAMGDSVYEYMLKVWVQGGRKEKMYREMWDKAMTGMHEQLVQKSKPNGLTYIADRIGSSLDHKMDHLACFMGGSLALSAYTDPDGLDSARAKRDLRTARALTYTCYQMYARMKTGIAPEFVRFHGENDFAKSSAPFYILRPETVEAFYYLNKLTGDPIYREWGWEVFQSIEKYCKTQYGYGSLKDVDRPGSVEDRMESFFMAETLKYLWLLFDPDSEIDILNKVSQ